MSNEDYEDYLSLLANTLTKKNKNEALLRSFGFI